jgi:Ca-activated chloride channel family protein
VPRIVVLAAVIVVVGIGLRAQSGAPAAQTEATPIFRSAIERVAVAAVVRDSKGRLVKDLKERDFELIDSGRQRPLIGVWSEMSPASVAVLMDVSGSMATKLERAKETAHLLVSGLQPGVDESALYSFDTGLKELRPFSKNHENSSAAFGAARAFGATSLWDAIAHTAGKVAERQQRRALVVITDGVDSASRLKPSEVSAIASSLDVPVYIVVIGFMYDDDTGVPASIRGPLADLASWSGGDSLPVRDRESALLATRQILAELNHQYVIAFEPGATPGWHPLVLRTRKEGLFVRTRSGYMVGARPASIDK